ncbi:B-cell receptor CD22-like [Limanda limanda]|uniref:B-cell receptor CD22-like n=1 Tax=Limanda limanda TaxID=27771 RepID=UPI0029C6A3A8|nr:B-cell receptor CD22-like [Limanda limanda]
MYGPPYQVADRMQTAVLSQIAGGVSYTSTEICAVRGSTVEINCTYTYPSSSGDSGVYSCKSENQYGFTSTSLHLDVHYAPKPPSVSVSPSGEIMEGSSVTLTCSSDANPAAHYTWYKEDEDSPTASGQIFTITDITAEHGGKYQCEAQNTHGRSNTTLHLTVGAGKSVIIMNIIRLTLVVVLVPVLVWTLWTRMKKTLSLKSEVNEAVEMIEVS